MKKFAISFPAVISISLMVVTGNSFAQWTQTSGPSGGSVSCFTDLGSYDVFAGAEENSQAGGGVFLSTNNGVSWIPENNGLTDLNVNSLFIDPRNGDLLAGTKTAGVFLSTNLGSSWTAEDSGLSYVAGWPVTSFAMAGNDLFIGVTDRVYASTNDGGSWSFSGSIGGGLEIDFINALVDSGSRLYAGTFNGMFVSTNGGTSWTQKDSGLSNDSVYTLATDGGSLLAGTAGGVFISTNSGTTWSEVLSGESINALDANGANVFAGTRNAGIYLSTDSGFVSTWSSVNTGLGSFDVDAIHISGSSVFAGTTEGGAYLSPNGGTSWLPINSGMANTVVQALAVSGKSLIAATNGQGISISTDRGRSWNSADLGLTNMDVTSLGVAGSDVYAGTYGSGVFLSTNEGSSWAATGLNSGNISALHFSGGKLFAASSGKGLYESTDDGASWIQSNVGGQMYINALAEAGTTLFAGTVSGVYLSTDDGISWTSTGGNGFRGWITSLAVSSSKIFAGTVSSGVFLSTDNGITWDQTSTKGPVSVAALKVSGNFIYAGTYGQGVFFSSNDGATWADTSLGTVNLREVYSIADYGNLVFAGTGGSGVWQYLTPEPSIISINDVPFDQGGYVNVTWSASSLDTNVNNLTSYSIWRAIQPGTGQSSRAKSPSSKMSVATASHPTKFITTSNGVMAFDWLGDEPAHRFSRYSFIAPTVSDSMAGNNGMEYFMVSAQVSDPNTFYDSNIDSGYSVDNIPPGAPMGLAANVVGDSVNLHWKAVAAPDLWGYQIYRSTTAISSVSALTPYANTTDTTFVDDKPITSSKSYYVVVAKDIRGNLSPLSNQISLLLTGVSSKRNLPKTYALLQNFPNPFNPTTVIDYQLPKNSFVTLKVYDMLGRVVATLVNGEESAGSYSVTFDGSRLASGVYFYRLVAGSFVSVKKLMLIK